MNVSKRTLEVLNECAEVSSRTGKEKILADNWSETLERIAYYAYNPFLRFHVSRGATDQMIGDGEEGDTEGVENGEMFDLLDDLAKRAVTGGAALDAVDNALHEWNFSTGELFRRILGKDLRCGISEKTFNKVYKAQGGKGKLIPEFDVQLASKYEPKRWKQSGSRTTSQGKLQYPALVEPKLDGMRVVVFVAPNGEVEIKSRGGREISSLNFVKNQFSELRTMSYPDQAVMFDAEVISGSFNDTVSLIKKKEQDAKAATIYLFDVLTFYVKEDSNVGAILQSIENDGHNDKLCRRLDMLKIAKTSIKESPDQFSNISILNDYEMANDENDVMQAYARFKVDGYEGAIVKDLQAPYEFKRSKGWQKVKPSETHDLEVTGVQEGTGKYVGHLGALIVDMNGVRLNVGTGFSDNDRSELWRMRDDLIGRIVEVEGHEMTPDGSLRHPRFVRFRDTLEKGVKE